jgi:hypothetical protein
VDQGGLTLNGRPATDAAAGVGTDALLVGRFLLVRRGRRDYRMLLRGDVPR